MGIVNKKKSLSAGTVRTVTFSATPFVWIGRGFCLGGRGLCAVCRGLAYAGVAVWSLLRMLKGGVCHYYYFDHEGIRNLPDLKVWLDDVRQMPNGYNKHVKTAMEAIALLKTGKVVRISVDNDLGENCLEGHRVVDYIEEQVFNNNLMGIEVLVHSSNSSRRIWIEQAIENINSLNKAWAERQKAR